MGYYLSKAERENIIKNYTHVQCSKSWNTENCPFYNSCDKGDSTYGCRLHDEYKWETARIRLGDELVKGMDKFMVNHEHKLYRSRNFHEFYGNRDVD